MGNDNVNPVFKSTLDSIAPKIHIKAVIDGADVHKHAQAYERLKTLAQKKVQCVDPVDLWDIRDELVTPAQLSNLLLLIPEYYVAISRDTISHDGPEIFFFRKKQSMEEFIIRFITDMLEGRYKDEQEYLDELKADDENIDEYRGKGFYFFPYTYFGDDVQIKWGSASEILTLKD